MQAIFLLEGGLLSVDTGLFWWVLLTFGLFIFVISKFAWKPVLAALNEREENIRTSLQSAEKALAQAQDVARKNEETLRQAEADAQKIRRTAIEDAEALRADRAEKAKAEAERMIEEARKAIAAEQKLAMQALRKEVAELAVLAAERILSSEINAEKNKKLVDDYIGSLNKN